MAGARAAALEALLRVDGEEGYSNIVLDSVLKKSSLSQKDSSLATAIFYGVLERRITLDYIIGLFSKRPAGKLSPAVREILRMGAYQLFFLKKIPPSAAVNESVKLTKKSGEFRASGFVNAVLRNMLRKREKIRFPDAEKEPLRYRSIYYSVPEKLIKLWQECYGNKCADSILHGISAKPDIFIRVNNTRISEQQLIKRLGDEGIGADVLPWSEHALRVRNPSMLYRSACYSEGLFHVQDISSQLCSCLIGAKAGERVFDVCAAPGGKTFTIAEQMKNKGEVLSFDIHPARTELISNGALRLGLSAVHAGVRDAADPKGEIGQADRVLCDVPCSGLGVIRRKPEIRYKFPIAIDSLPDLQYRILCRSSELVRKGGIIIYSTCTLNPDENSGVAERFSKNNMEFEPLPLLLPREISHAVKEPENQLTLIPQEHGPDGFFISAFRRR